MNKICIRAHDLGKFTAPRLAETVRGYGFDGLHLCPSKALEGEFSPENVDVLAKAFAGLEITLLGASFNPVHPDAAIVREGINHFKRMLRIAGPLGALYVGSGTGSLAGPPWDYVPQNHAPQTLVTVSAVFRELADYAGLSGGTVAVQGAWAQVANTPERIRAMLETIQNPNLKVAVDLFNFLNPANHEDRMNILERCFEALRDDIVIFHLKDYVIEDGAIRQVGLGQGLMDFPAIIARIVQEAPNARLVLEGVTGADIQTSFELINGLVMGANAT